jgi:hypothetical protein
MHTRIPNVEFYAELRKETDRGYCFYDGANEFWLPKSQVVILQRMRGGNVQAAVPEWLAKNEGII